jgi:uncharacterized lipoprotein YddW (UPF0748 family)
MNPKPQRSKELRGVWIATVNNGDWPSRKDLTVEQQKRELVAILDRVAALHLNAVFLQVRPMADAFYPSPYEPWSEFLTGELGRDPGYDPLAFAIAEAHARGIELHAWFNPFRGNVKTSLRSYPYGRFQWMDPGDPAVRQRGIDVITDVVQRYDIDGVHMDDYFYPYPENNLAFPDEATFAQYGSGMTRDDWRRDNINRFVRDLYTSVKSIKPHIEVGISPFGIWRPGNPAQIKGFDAYDKLYADSKLWLRRGWVDYLAPQLYWPIDKREQSFPALLHWWTSQDKLGRGIVAGMSINRVSRVGTDEFARQIQLIRDDDGAVGFILFSAKTLMKDTEGVNRTLLKAIDG